MTTTTKEMVARLARLRAALARVTRPERRAEFAAAIEALEWEIASPR